MPFKISESYRWMAFYTISYVPNFYIVSSTSPGNIQRAGHPPGGARGSKVLGRICGGVGVFGRVRVGARRAHQLRQAWGLHGLPAVLPQDRGSHQHAAQNHVGAGTACVQHWPSLQVCCMTTHPHPPCMSQHGLTFRICYVTTLACLAGMSMSYVQDWPRLHICDNPLSMYTTTQAHLLGM